MAYKTVVTLVGRDHPGIIAPVCTYFAENSINILNISQTVMDEFITMMMLVDLEGCPKNYAEVCSDLAEVGKKVGCKIQAQREDIFDMMYRVRSWQTSEK